MAWTLYHLGEKIKIFLPIVDMGNECHKIIHANKGRKYYTRTLACGLTAEEGKKALSIDAE